MRWTPEQYAEYMNRQGTSYAPNAKRRALGRMPAGKMNKLETAFAGQLKDWTNEGKIIWWKFEGIKLRLADNTFLTVDFAAMAADGLLTMYECKGFMEEDANVKLKVAASVYPFKFVLVRKGKSGSWTFKEIQ